MLTNPAVEQNKKVKWSESPESQSGRHGLLGCCAMYLEQSVWRCFPCRITV